MPYLVFCALMKWIPLRDPDLVVVKVVPVKHPAVSLIKFYRKLMALVLEKHSLLLVLPIVLIFWIQV